MSDDRDLLAAWALDAVDEDERARIEERLRTDPVLRAEADALLRATDRLGAGEAVAPPAGLRDRVLDAIAAEARSSGDAGAHSGAPSAGPGPAAPASLQDHRERRRPGRRRAWAAVAATAAAAAAAAALLLAHPWQPAGLTERDQAVAIEQVLEQDGARRGTAPVAGGGTVEVARAPSGETVLAARDLPAPQGGRVYQLWTLRGQGDPESAGLLELEDGRALVRLDGVPETAALAVTVEPAGGSTAPTTDPVVVLTAG
ncbi:anti-sigma factor [Citricoccus sp. SGAir0253]|uniref:anti-sigma factor n=1 Tax=Citricoccus sp. SGAir0253 TaxID=2567881 RepID=UPI0010CD3092|nr:anti-sigma factor [Citricoccus sp. SGAir0253]QCU79043.1 anti-sigma factor [Citricoccus sp. SGAir0253]